MQFQDYYEVLRVPRDATPDAIRKAYRKLALQWHPDRHQGDARAEAEARFKAISEAYEVLSDPETRRKYDRFGRDWKHGQDFQPPAGGARPMSAEEFQELFGAGAGGFSDFFRSVFGDDVRQRFGGRARHERFRVRGADVQAELVLAVSDAIAGGKRGFEIDGRASCERCGGVGMLGEHVCPACVGVGRRTVRRRVDLTIPALVRDGARLRLKGLGEPGEGGAQAGDLLLTLRLADDEAYRVQGDDLELDVPLAPWEALSGTRVDVRVPQGVVTVTVPPDTRAGARLRLRGKGLPDGRGGRGDAIVAVRLALPPALTPRQRELLAELGRAGPGRVTGGARVPEGRAP